MDNAKAKVRHTRKYGRGVYATARIRKGEEIASFDGPFYDDDFDDWTPDLLNHAIQCGPALWRDSKGIARILNHSCDPNCGVRGKFKLVAMRDISIGEQLTWDYEMTENSDWWLLRCRCGSKLCRKRIGRFDRMPAEVRRKYRGYISWWLTSRE